MIRSELVLRVAAMNPHLYARDVERVVDAILGRIETALAQGDRVEMRGFGTFSIRQRAARNGRNPRTGAAVTVEEKARVHFKPSKVMEERLNLGTAGSAEQGERFTRMS